MARLGVSIQHLLPQRALTALAHRISTARAGWIRRPLIAGFRRLYEVDLDEAVVPASGFDSFDSFFTRALKPDARPPASVGTGLLCPCDGTLSQAGPIFEEPSGGRIVQAKGRDYSLAELLADEKAAEAFTGGRFATVYLAPYDYHRVHVPCDATLRTEIRVPGRLFSVSDATSRHIDRLFARNERMVALFDTAHGPMAVVMVAAMLVAGIETVWDAGLRLRPGRDVARIDFDPTVRLSAGAELGRFHWGSTVIVVTGRDAPDWVDGLVPGRRMRLGEALTGPRAPGRAEN
ncbi:phosphatidylserine decarboxylase [Wenzhouxiangella sp. XN79A]|nr:archaetidylserine decarboxylase [Wenzhouxiangella sp. XN79A]NKI35907.1 phosphatidylserine decarboxylase [Wenzhouxiangella sp. XN79A]